MAASGRYPSHMCPSKRSLDKWVILEEMKAAPQLFGSRNLLYTNPANAPPSMGPIQ